MYSLEFMRSAILFLQVAMEWVKVAGPAGIFRNLWSLAICVNAKKRQSIPDILCTEKVSVADPLRLGFY